MEQMSHKKSISQYCMSFATCLIVALFSGHALQTILSFKDYLLFLAGAVAILFLIARKDFWRLDLSKGALFIFLGMIVCTFIVSLGSGLWFYLTLAAMLFVAYAVTEFFSFESVVDLYVKVMTVVSIVGLVGYLLLQNGLLPELPVLTNHNDVEYGAGIIFNYILLTPERNCGMFWEPGLFATHLTIATVFEILRPQKTSFWRILLFSVCIFTANSSAGFVLWFLCLLLLLVKRNNRKLGLISGIIGILVSGAAIVLILNFDAILSSTALGDNEYFSKLSSDSVEESSRALALAHNWELFAANPFFGAGISTVTDNMAHVADTSTSTYLLSIFGIPAILYTVFLVYGVFKLRGVNIFAKIVVLTIVLIIVNKEPHCQILFTWCLLFYLLKQAKRPKVDKQEEAATIEEAVEV